ncbi:MAG: LuxE/PaaK family acyltransferase, partial [Candidatus Helarchaeota archaeon]
VRDPETLEPVKPGEIGLLEVLTPYGINGYSSCAIIVDDLVQLIGDNDSVCNECGYKGARFIHKGRQSPPDGKSCSSILDFFERIH